MTWMMWWRAAHDTSRKRLCALLNEGQQHNDLVTILCLYSSPEGTFKLHPPCWMPPNVILCCFKDAHTEPMKGHLFYTGRLVQRQVNRWKDWKRLQQHWGRFNPIGCLLRRNRAACQFKAQEAVLKVLCCEILFFMIYPILILHLVLHV